MVGTGAAGAVVHLDDFKLLSLTSGVRSYEKKNDFQPVHLKENEGWARVSLSCDRLLFRQQGTKLQSEKLVFDTYPPPYPPPRLHFLSPKLEFVKAIAEVQGFDCKPMIIFMTLEEAEGLSRVLVDNPRFFEQSKVSGWT